MKRTVLILSIVTFLFASFSPYDGDEKLETDAVVALGLAFKPKWFLTYVSEQGKTANGSVIGTGTGVAETSIPEIWNIGGESADASLGYHLRNHCTGEGTYTFIVELEVEGKKFSDSLSFRVS